MEYHLKCTLELQVLFFLQNINDGAQPVAIVNSLDRSCDLFGDVDIPDVYDKTEINAILANSTFSDLGNYYNKTEIDAIVSNINVRNNHYTKAEIDDIGMSYQH